MTGTRTAVVTGGNRGIGLEVCRRLGRLGYRVVLTGRDRDRVEAAASGLLAEGAEVVARILDVTDARSIRDLAEAMETEFGGADVLVNNAAVLLGEDGDVLTVP